MLATKWELSNLHGFSKAYILHGQIQKILTGGGGGGGGGGGERPIATCDFPGGVGGDLPLAPPMSYLLKSSTNSFIFS